MSNKTYALESDTLVLLAKEGLDDFCRDYKISKNNFNRPVRLSSFSEDYSFYLKAVKTSIHLWR